MRVEDLDRDRTRPEAVLGNLAELRWLGLDWDEGPDIGGPYAPYLQSARLGLYRAALQRLEERGLLFESFLSRRELAGEEVYGAAQRQADDALRRKRGAAGRQPSLRFRSSAGDVAFNDLTAGRRSYDAERDVGDFVVKRADGQFAYQLAVVVDDAAMRISEVARGADLLSSTAAQLLLYQALELPPPAFAHVGLLLGPDDEKLSKRNGPTSLRELEAAGLRPERIVGLLAASLGLLPKPAEVRADELLGVHESGFDLVAPYRLAAADLEWLHA